jgi:HPt (histidine-containing phosphotransfer) domain-containing protein
MKLTVDLTFLNEISDGDQEFITDVLQTFLEEMPKDMRQLREAIAAKNVQDIGKVAHKTKSTLQTLGLHDLREMAFTIEQNAKDRIPITVEELSERATSFAGYIDKACIKVKTLLD